MARCSIKMLLFVLLSVMMIACAAKTKQEPKSQTTAGTAASGKTMKGQAVKRVELEEYMEEKVNNFLVILDASGSKFRPYKGKVKLRIAKETVRRFNEKTPDRPLMGALRRYGFEAGAWSEPTALIYGVGKYDREAYGKAIDKILWAGGKSPLPKAINASGIDLEPLEGYLSLVIVSDGKINDDDPLLNDILMEMDDNPVLAGKYRAKSKDPELDRLIMEMESDPDLADRVLDMATQVIDVKNDLNKVESVLRIDPEIAAIFDQIDIDPVMAAKILVPAAKLPSSLSVLAAKDLKEKYGDRICIFTVQIGNLPYGKNLLEQIARVGGCGYAVTSDYLGPDKNMDDFVHDVFTRGQPKLYREMPAITEKCPDSDGDGVCDQDDECPGTPKGARVDERGCWILDKVQFDLNKWNIKAQYIPIIDEVARVMKLNPDLHMEIHGHTCTIWTERYNMKLSHWRALSVTSELLKRGVDSRMISVKGFGFHRPVASNKTEAGRILNRRVEFHPVK